MGVLHATGNIGYAPNAEAAQGSSTLRERHLGRKLNADGPVVNLIPKEGGNTSQGKCLRPLHGLRAPELENLNDELQARGLSTVTSVRYVFDAGASLGGPIKRDVLWFFYSHRNWGQRAVRPQANTTT